MTKGDLLLLYSQIVFSPCWPPSPCHQAQKLGSLGKCSICVSNIDSLNQMVTGNAGSRKNKLNGNLCLEHTFDVTKLQGKRETYKINNFILLEMTKEGALKISHRGMGLYFAFCSLFLLQEKNPERRTEANERKLKADGHVCNTEKVIESVSQRFVQHHGYQGKAEVHRALQSISKFSGTPEGHWVSRYCSALNKRSPGSVLSIRQFQNLFKW